MLLQIPHYNLAEATEAIKPVMGEYYREPKKAEGPLPLHLVEPLVRSFQSDHYVADEGDIVYYQRVSPWRLQRYHVLPACSRSWDTAPAVRCWLEL